MKKPRQADTQPKKTKYIYLENRSILYKKCIYILYKGMYILITCLLGKKQYLKTCHVIIM